MSTRAPATSRTPAASRPRDVAIHPLTPDRWNDFVTLFDRPGQHRSCSCMWWTLPSSSFNQGKAANRAAMHERVRSAVPGLLAYAGGEVAGWVSVAPRSQFGRVERSTKLQPVDDKPAWSITCFWIDKAHRDRGIAGALLNEAIAYARRNGARLIEAYPIVSTGPLTDNHVFSGTPAFFARAGFREVANRDGVRAVWRKQLRAAK